MTIHADEYPLTQAEWYADQHTEALALGLPCPFDCAACEARANRHEHPTACGHPVTCEYDACLYEPRPAPVVACAACQPAPTPVPGPHADPWASVI